MRIVGIVGGVVLLAAAIAGVAWLSQIGISRTQSNDQRHWPSTSTGALPKPGGAPAKNAEGEYLTNPFPKPASGPFPKLEVDAEEFDFGVMAFDPDHKLEDSHVFVVRNVGEAPLKLARGPSTCQCTMSDLQDQVEVPPGGSTEITVTWKPEAPAEEFSKGASIWTNDPALFAEETETKDGKIMFVVKGQVLPGVELEPSVFSLGTLDETKPTRIEGKVFSRVMDNLEVAVKETSSEFVTAELEPLSAEELPSRARSGWRLIAHIEPKLSVGRVRESIRLTTNDPTHPEVTIEITAHRQGPVTLAGKFWNNAETVVDFRRFPAAKGIETNLSLYASRQEQPLELQVLEKKPDWLDISVAADPSYQEEDRERWTVKVRVPPDVPPTRMLGKEAGRVLLKTNREDVPEIRFYVIFESE